MELARVAHMVQFGEPWKPCRTHEGPDGPYFEIDPEEAAEYARRPFKHIYNSVGETMVTGHDLFVFDAGVAERICDCVNAFAGIIDPGACIDEMRQVLRAVRGGRLRSDDTRLVDLLARLCGDSPQNAPEPSARNEFPNNTCPACGASEGNGHADDCTVRGHLRGVASRGVEGSKQPES